MTDLLIKSQAEIYLWIKSAWFKAPRVIERRCEEVQVRIITIEEWKDRLDDLQFSNARLSKSSGLTKWVYRPRGEGLSYRAMQVLIGHGGVLRGIPVA